MSTAGSVRLRIRLRGTVQGVGFRPFVKTLAARHGLSGFVLNDSNGVLAEIEGAATAPFLIALQNERPPLARIDGMDIAHLQLERQPGFEIRESSGQSPGRAQIGPDAATCAACLAEIFDPASRFWHYPFTTCTDCGPRFTISRRLPYDRANTAMAGFAMCQECRSEYGDVRSRRYHAEAIACAACGPILSHTMAEIAAALRQGMIVALKGNGGYHLLCDAMNDVAVRTLRRRKQRPGKPFAIMVADAAAAAHIGTPSRSELGLLRHKAGPIVMIPASGVVAPSVAPGLVRLGVMLPSTPLHHLLFDALAGAPAVVALVATSGNEAGNPLVIDDDEARLTFAALANLVVTHDRPILARADDSVLSVIDGAPFFIRRARGYVPDPIDLGSDGPPVLAVGGHLKATVCVTRGREAFISQHVGDLGTPATVRFFAQTAARLLAALHVAPEWAACDLHPDYRSTMFAEESGLKVLRVQHHAAHVAAVAAEHQLRGPVLGVALDGHGLGTDGATWGGELLLLDGAAWQRRGHLRPLKLPGGDRAAREPWRMGVAALVSLGRGAEAAGRFPTMALAAQVALLAGNESTPTTTSLGRLFDAAAALLGVCLVQGYEGQAAMELEALVRVPRCLAAGYRIAGNILDFTPLLATLLTPGLYASEGAELFHGTLIAGLAAWIKAEATQLGQTDIVLGGGCLMNRVLTEGLLDALRAGGLVPYLPRAVPANDGGLSLGQAAIARAHLMIACGHS